VKELQHEKLFTFVLGGLAVVAIALLIWIWWPKTGKPSATPLSEPTPSVSFSSPALSWPEFETVTLNNLGKEVDRRKLIAQYFTEDLDGLALDMVKVPSGTFEMGSPNSEAQRDNHEGPQHSVTVPEFFMGRFEVTREQWRQVAKMPRVKINLKEDPSKFKGSLKQPVEQVSWNEVVEFCKRLEKKTGKPYRLPSEAEWEYAARAGTTTPFAFGPTITPNIVSYDGNYPYGSAPKGGYQQKTVGVGSLGVANAFGLYDMHGKVWEWCEDAWHGDYKGAPSDGSAWLSGGDSTKRVLRGGSWNDIGRFCRSAYRAWNGAGNRNFLNGFRVVLAARTR
jgi:formylglycine-generating enzyme required for sulfatase activity